MQQWRVFLHLILSLSASAFSKVKPENKIASEFGPSAVTCHFWCISVHVLSSGTI